MDEVIRMFNDNCVRYLLIGGQALRLEGMPRFTMDWDFYIPPSDLQNIARIEKALGDELDVPLLPLGPKGRNFVQTYQTRWGVLQFHLGGPGLPPFEEVEGRATVHKTDDGLAVRCMSGKDLLESKMAANRPQDQLDIRFLRKKHGIGLP